jgi:hypothetical protein
VGSAAAGGDDGSGAVDGVGDGAGVAVDVGAVVADRVGAGVAEDAGIGVPVQPASSATRAIRGMTAVRRIPECYASVHPNQVIGARVTESEIRDGIRRLRRV